MRWADIPRNPPESTLRRFAAVWLLWFAALGGGVWILGGFGTAVVALFGAALAVGVPGLLRPAAVRPVFVGLIVLTFPVGWLVSRLLLGAVYYGMFTPLGLFFRLIGRDALGRRLDPKCESYWSPKPPPKDPRSYFHQS